MRIIFPIRRYCNGSAAMNRILGYVNGFVLNGAEVWLYFFITNKDEERLSISASNVHVVYLWEDDSAFYKRFRLLELIKNLFLFRKKIKKGDTIFLYGRANYFYLMAWSLRRKSKIFCEITEHPEYQGTGLLRRLDIKLSNELLKSFDGLFVISNTLRKYFISKGLNEKKVIVINMFVDGNRFLIEPIEKQKKYIAYCGSVSKIKDGVDILIQSFARFYDNYPDYYLFIIGGSGDDEPLDYFKNLAVRLNVDKNVIFTGKISSEKIPEFLANATILALSRPDSLQARNGFPTKLGEYLATGVPVVVTNVGEIPFFIKDGVNGLVAKESDVDDFTKKLLWVAEHPQEAKKIGEKGKDLVFNEFSYEVQAKKAMAIMEIC